MQFITILALGLSALVSAAPVEDVQGDLVARGGGGGYPSEMWCPKGSKSGCCPCENRSCKQAQGGQGDFYSSCSYNKQLSLLADLFVCDVLNNNQVAVPISLSIPVDLL